MKNKFTKYTHIVFAVLLSAALAACSTKVNIKNDKLQYLAAADVESIKLPEVPQQGSALFDSDFKTLHEYQDKRTADECSIAQKDANLAFENMFPELKDFYHNLPAVNKEFMNSIGKETSAAVAIMKAKFARPRPYITDETLSPCISKPKRGSLAYPSGHTTKSRIYALLLTELMPQRRAEFLSRAEDIARSRILGGVHHPTDIEAGRRFANALFAKYMQNKLFRANVNNLRQYLPKK